METIRIILILTIIIVIVILFHWFEFVKTIDVKAIDVKEIGVKQLSRRDEEIIYNPNIVETTRSSALLYMESIKAKGLKIVDFGGGTQGHLHYADTVADMQDHTAWYKKYFPKKRFVPGANIQHKLRFVDDEFDYVWSSHVAEHVPDPNLFCSEMRRISKYGGVICLPRPLSDNLLEPTEEIKFGHKWWVLHNDTTLQFMPRQTILVHHYQKRIVQYNNFMRSYFGSSWEMCVVFKNPLRCDIIKPTFENWSKSVNKLPLIYQKATQKELKLT